MREYKDIAYLENGGPEHTLDIYLPEGEGEGFLTFLYFHGGGLEMGDKASKFAPILSKYFTDRGIAFVSANYRLYPDAKFPDFIEDAAAATAWVMSHIKEYGADGRIVLGGSSAGGYLSMMLCYDAKYLGAHGLAPTNFTAFIHDAGQPTTHFNVLRERGLNTRFCIIDEAAPIYHVGRSECYVPQLFFIAEQDMVCRYEQTLLLLKTLESLGYDMSTVKLEYMEGYKHCKYVRTVLEDGTSPFGIKVMQFLTEQGIV